ncbi:hypothetical protein G6F50_015482 [Rhizopus delemar]|uniref:RNA polymerase sigma-70 domain-containing protein n=1 Tax=Rhizopus delemar TaxID=936053 RepID=A0A9P7C3Z1_9FUNG|nr:hypothetical protein G6F50_015482 [Rhizopus delemar]
MAYERADSEDNQMQLLREGLAELDARSRDIIRRRWLDADSKVTLQELADEYGVSAERIRQVEANALKKMKALFTAGISGTGSPAATSTGGHTGRSCRPDRTASRLRSCLPAGGCRAGC